MTDYTELVKALRSCGKYALCNDCPIFEMCDGDVDKAMAISAAAIEALQAEIRESMQKCAECSQWNEPLQVGKAGNEFTLNAPERPHWVSVEELMPQKFQNVLVANKRGKVFDIDKAWWNGACFDRCGKKPYWNVTHWMPLPEPPKEDA